ncbi:hypothetical protein RRG08_020018 [Elysia crispata]|uniref:Uncharacterized protein n=1 Tax=Elysia crispata TaxID=231223 RepID=A0AAE1BCU4_9GAST|nr:hypothetical protein RRG08_020018 [Elysia crispata]
MRGGSASRLPEVPVVLNRTNTARRTPEETESWTNRGPRRAPENVLRTFLREYFIKTKEIEIKERREKARMDKFRAVATYRIRAEIRDYSKHKNFLETCLSFLYLIFSTRCILMEQFILG